MDRIADPLAQEHVDVLIVGAGLSGIGAACRLRERCPGQRFAILEARDRSGGTWDLFRYPRRALGFRHVHPRLSVPAVDRHEGDRRRARHPRLPARDGARARRRSLDPLRPSRRPRRLVERARHLDGRGRVAALRRDAAPDVRLLFMCSGYYRYDQGHAPAFEGADAFAGRIVHRSTGPTIWTSRGKRVVVIGSGADRGDPVPALARAAAKVTMLQRSPTWMLSAPVGRRPREAAAPHPAARARNAVMRWQRVLLTLWFYGLCRRRPDRARKLLLGGVRAWMGKDRALDPDFTPRYDPWRQRLCLVPDGDLFRALKSGRAAIVTGEIERFTPGGVRLAGGEEIGADVVVTATGLVLEAFGGANDSASTARRSTGRAASTTRA
jgi:cation diffusion facilitator CzcD-associated flavoprotein CzcO